MLLAPVPALFYALLSQKLAPAGEHSTDMSAASAAFCISVQHHNNRKTMLLCCYDYFVGVSSCCCLQMPLALGQPGISVRYWHQHANAPSANHAYRLCSKICGFLVLYLWKSSLYSHIYRWKINNIWENLVPKKRTRFLFLAYVNEICWCINDIGWLQEKWEI